MIKRKIGTARHSYYFNAVIVLVLILSLNLLLAACKPSNSQDTGLIEAEYPPPQNLFITGFSGSGSERTVDLAWDAPDTGLTIITYAVYRNGVEADRTASTNYQNIIGDKNYDLYVTAIYTGDIESSPSNMVNTQIDADMPAVDSGEETAGTNGELESGTNSESTGFNENDDAEQITEYDTVASGLCSNPYYPVAVGISHTYNVTSSGGSYTFVSTVTDVRENGFTVTWVTGDATQKHEWSCQPEGLAHLNPQGAAESISIDMEDLHISGSSEVTGVSIPNSISAGDTWVQTYSGPLVLEEYDTKLECSATVSFTAVGEESVTVPAGTFTAMRVDSTSISEYVLETHGATVPLYTNNITASSWLVEGIGSVKSITNSDIKGQVSLKVTSTMELTEYSLP